MIGGGEVELALCNDPSHLELPDIDGVVLFEEPMLVALPREHRLATRKSLTLAELAHAARKDPLLLRARRTGGLRPTPN